MVTASMPTINSCHWKSPTAIQSASADGLGAAKAVSSDIVRVIMHSHLDDRCNEASPGVAID